MRIKNMLSFFLVTVLLGLTSVALYQANNPSTPPASENQQLIDIITQQELDIEKMEQKMDELRLSIDTELGQQTQGLSVISSLRNSLQSARYFSGLSERTGEGIIITLTDNVQGAEIAKAENPSQYRPDNYILHDKNLLYIVNDLKAANPDGIAINNQRLVSNTNIRCVGTVILVNDRRLAPPYQISVLGDKDKIMQAIFDSGEVEYLVSSGFSITYEESDEIVLPAFKGNLNLQYAKRYVEPVEEIPMENLQDTVGETSSDTEDLPDENNTVYTDNSTGQTITPTVDELESEGEAEELVDDEANQSIRESNEEDVINNDVE